MFIIPSETPGIEIVKNHGFYGEPEDSHGHLKLTDVRVPADHMLGGRGDAFVVAQTRLGGGRMHHAMRTIAQATRALELTCERVLSRTTKGEQLAAKQMVQERLTHMLSLITQMQLLVAQVTRLADAGQLTGEQASLAKYTTTRQAREVASIARDMLGGNGILLGNRVARHFADLEALHTYEGTESMQALIVGRDITGVSAFA